MIAPSRSMVATIVTPKSIILLKVKLIACEIAAIAVLIQVPTLVNPAATAEITVSKPLFSCMRLLYTEGIVMPILIIPLTPIRSITAN